MKNHSVKCFSRSKETDCVWRDDIGIYMQKY